MTGRPDADEERDIAIRDVLLGWGDPSRGDVSVICAILRERGGTILTSTGSAQACFWQNMLALGYAEKVYSPIDPANELIETLAFRPTDKGMYNLPHFLIYYDLLNMGACTPASPATELSLPERRFAPPLQFWHMTVAGIFTLSGLYLASRGPNYLPLAFFLVTYSSVVTLLLRTRDIDGRTIRIIVSVNAAFLGVCTLIPLFGR
jgi:hypothetical protein